MTEEMREPTSNPESPEAVSDLPSKELTSDEQSEVKGGTIATKFDKAGDAIIRNIAG
jgi:hypothetical protein